MAAPDKRWTIGVVGLGVVGNAVFTVLRRRCDRDGRDSLVGGGVHGYDKYRSDRGDCESLDALVAHGCDLLFLCLPTEYSVECADYDLVPLDETLALLADMGYTGRVVVKSTVTPGVTRRLASKYPRLRLLHNPEFLNARTSEHDFEHQQHIVLGRVECDDDDDDVCHLFRYLWPTARLSLCAVEESEMMKLACNTFYAVKVQFFNEVYHLCSKSGAKFDDVREMMLRNGWINAQHTSVPGPDGELSYGGMCLPKDSSAFLEFARRVDSPHAVVRGCVTEHCADRQAPY